MQPSDLRLALARVGFPAPCRIADGMLSSAEVLPQLSRPRYAISRAAL